MFKSTVTAVFTLLLCSAFLCGCGKQSKEKTFTVGFDADFKPYGYVENDTYTGFDIDLAREVAKRNNWKLVLKAINWDAKDMELNTGAIDCIWNGFTINGRENAYTWSSPYVDNSQVVMVRKDSKVQKLSERAGLVVAVQTDTPVLKARQKGGKRADLGSKFKKLVVSPNYNNAVMELEAGSVDAVALDIGVAQEKSKDGKFRILEEVVITEKYGIGFRKGNTALRDQVESTLKAMVSDGTAAKISAKYFNGRDCLIIGK